MLPQSYDWPLFLTDDGISRFITELLLNKQRKELLPVKAAFEKSYGADKKVNVFTKVRMATAADAALSRYFAENIEEIEGWINIISPQNKAISVLKQELFALSNKDWEEIYS